MKCPFCGSEETKVVDSRTYLDGNSIKRRRECEDCQKRFTTYEKIGDLALYVLKKDGVRQEFSREKVYSSIIRALEKRKIDRERIEETKEEISWLQGQQYIVQRYEAMKNNPDFKVRVTHHDTKISNVLFDDADKGICVIDLDTVMPGYFTSDVGDMMRTCLPPVSEEEKDFSKIPNGAPGIETRTSTLYDLGVVQGRISLNRFVALIATTPAKLFGLFPQKGTIAVGSDADIVLFDPNEKYTVHAEHLHGNCDHTLLEGRTLLGKVKKVFLRGELIVDGDFWLGKAGGGRFVPRGNVQAF